jgi:hypothetical protein
VKSLSELSAVPRREAATRRRSSARGSDVEELRMRLATLEREYAELRRRTLLMIAAVREQLRKEVVRRRQLERARALDVAPLPPGRKPKTPRRRRR